MTLDEEIKGALGIAPGPTLLALTKAARQLRRKSPSAAFDALLLFLPWLKSKSEREAESLLTADIVSRLPDWHRRSVLGEYLGTPSNVLAFAHTGDNSTHFGFLKDVSESIEDAPVVMVLPREEDKATQVIAPSLRDFLSLLTVSFAPAMVRGATDEEWLVTRKEWFGDDPPRLAEMDKVSNVLCEQVPGVRRPDHPSHLAAAHPPMEFTLTVPYSDGARSKLVVSDHDQARSAAVRAARLLPQQEFERAATLARVGMSHPSSRARSLYLLARALTRLGRTREALAVVDELGTAWLDETPAAPPAVHARRAIDKKEMCELLQAVKHPNAALLIERVEKAGDLRDADGDWL